MEDQTSEFENVGKDKVQKGVESEMEDVTKNL